MKKKPSGYTNLAREYLLLLAAFLKVVDRLIELLSGFVNYERPIRQLRV